GTAASGKLSQGSADALRGAGDQDTQAGKLATGHDGSLPWRDRNPRIPFVVPPSGCFNVLPPEGGTTNEARKCDAHPLQGLFCPVSLVLRRSNPNSFRTAEFSRSIHQAPKVRTA